MDDKWNLSRSPTTAERAIGVAGALFLFAIGAVGFWDSTFVKISFPTSLVTGALAVLSMFFLIRFIFTTGGKLQRRGVIALAVVFTFAGTVMLVGSFFSTEIEQRLFLLSLGSSGIGGGMINLSKAKKMSNRLHKQTRASGPRV